MVSGSIARLIGRNLLGNPRARSVEAGIERIPKSGVTPGGRCLPYGNDYRIQATTMNRTIKHIRIRIPRARPDRLTQPASVLPQRPKAITVQTTTSDIP